MSEQPELRDRETTVNEVLAEYAKLTRRHDGYAASAQAWRAASAFLKWCKAEGVEQPLLFVWLRFRVVRSGRHTHNAHPSLENMPSRALIPRYKAIVERRRFESEMKARWDIQRERDLVSVGSGNEAVRRDYVVNERTDLCEAQQGLSGGYHPFSAWCPACPRAISCAQRTNEVEGIDVVALRLGRITPEQAAASRKRTG